MSKDRMKVIIVGGSVTGLSLAHSLDKIGVDYVILERRHEIAPQEGASIGILPNGARILDQLGLYETISKNAAPLGATQIYFPDGFHHVSTYPKRMFDTFGYPIAFMERQKLLDILYMALPDHSKIHVKNNVCGIEQFREKGGGVRVHTTDGDLYEADMVVGAEGVHSQVRKDMMEMG